MAKYSMAVRTALTPTEAFSYMADLTNFATWDPGVISAAQVAGEGPGLGASYDVEVKSVGGSMVLRYELVEFESPSRVVARAQSPRLTSTDVISVVADEVGDKQGSVVSYDAKLVLNGTLALGDPALQLVFNSIGDKAASGLVAALDGVRVEAL